MRWQRWVVVGLVASAAVAGCSAFRRPGPAPGAGQPGVMPPGQPRNTGAPARPPDALAGGRLAAELAAYLKGRPGQWSVWVEDLQSGAGLAVDASRHHAAGSTIKLPLALWLLEGWSRGEVDLDERLPYTAADREEGTGVLLHRAPGGRYPVRTLLQWAITHSDNVATKMLLRRYGREHLYAYMRSLGGQPEVRQDLTHVTPREMGLYLRRLWRGEQLSAPARDLLLQWLTRTVFPGRLRAGVPAPVPVAHKIGTLVGAVHDVGLVLHPARPYTLVVMSSGAPERGAEATIAGVSRLVWAHLGSGAH